MGVFLFNKRSGDYYKFVFTNRKGHTLFTGVSCKEVEDCEALIETLKGQLAFITFAKFKTPKGKLYFKMVKDEQVLATSRKFSTELMLEKGINYILKYMPVAEILDLPDVEDIFATEEEEEEESQDQEVI